MLRGALLSRRTEETHLLFSRRRRAIRVSSKGCLSMLWISMEPDCCFCVSSVYCIFPYLTGSCWSRAYSIWLGFLKLTERGSVYLFSRRLIKRCTHREGRVCVRSTQELPMMSDVKHIDPHMHAAGLLSLDYLRTAHCSKTSYRTDIPSFTLSENSSWISATRFLLVHCVYFGTLPLCTLVLF